MDRDRGFWSRKTGLAKKYDDFENGIPVHDTIARVVSNIDSIAFEKMFIDWIKLLTKILMTTLLQ